MTKAKKRLPHKEIFLEVADAIADLCKPNGFINHPIYETGWDRNNQDYSRHLIREDTSNFIDEIELSYMPAYRNFFFMLKRCNSTPELLRLISEKCWAGDWTDASYETYDLYRLHPQNRWRFSFTPAACLKKSDLNDPAEAAAKMIKRYRKYADRLFQAVDEKKQSLNVSVDYYGDTGTGKRISSGHRAGRF